MGVMTMAVTDRGKPERDIAAPDEHPPEEMNRGPPRVARSTDNRGLAAADSEGVVVGSGAGAGGGGSPEDYDHDPQAGGGRLPTHNPKGGRGGDAPKHNSQ
jgi:hypothetical protein